MAGLLGLTAIETAKLAPTIEPLERKLIMYRKIWTTAVLLASALATALGFAAATAGPSNAGVMLTIANRSSVADNPTNQGHAMHRTTKDHAARILVSLGTSYFATLLLLIFQP